MDSYLTDWRIRAWQTLTTVGASSLKWQQLFEDARFHLIPESLVFQAANATGLAYLERIAAFAFADGVIEPEELANFQRVAAELALPASAQLTNLQQRMLRGYTLSQIRAGHLPSGVAAGIHLDSDEIVHLDQPAKRIRMLARGSKVDLGQLLVSNKKIRFVGTSGTEVTWARIMSVNADARSVIVKTSTAAGEGTYLVSDPEYVAAVIDTALRIAKRQMETPGQRASRSIPQHIKAAVYQRDGGRCVQCGAQEYVEFDHIIPHSRGGATSVDNLQVLCRRCNGEKGARI